MPEFFVNLHVYKEVWDSYVLTVPMDGGTMTLGELKHYIEEKKNIPACVQIICMSRDGPELVDESRRLGVSRDHFMHMYIVNLHKRTRTNPVANLLQ